MAQDIILELLPYMSATYHMGKSTKLQKSNAQLVAERCFCLTKHTHSTVKEV